MRLRAMVVGVLLTFVPLASVRAQPAGAKPGSSAAAPADGEAVKKEAQEAFLRGREAFKARDYKGALAHFQKSQSLLPRPGTLFNLAACEQELGMLASAWKHFQELIPQLPQNDDRLPDAKERVAALGARVPRLRIKLSPGAPVSTSVSLDGAVLTGASIDTDIALDPGDHEIKVTASGRPERSYKVKLAEGERLTSEVEPLAGGQSTDVAALSPAMPEADESRGSSSARTAGFVVGGIGIAGLGVGAVTGILAITKKNQVDELCPTQACTREGVAIEDSGKALAAVSTVAFIVGVAGVGVGTFLVVWNGGSGAKKSAAVVAPSVLPGGAGITAAGVF